MREIWSDQKILKTIASDDSSKSDEAIKYIYATHFSSIKSYILTNSGEVDDAEDVFQEAIVIWYNMVKDGKFELKSSIKTFIYAVVRNIWLNQLRKKKSAHTVDLNILEAEEALDDGVESNINSTKILDRMMKFLGKECQQILVSFYFHKNSMAEIMETFGLSSVQVTRNKKYKCMQQLMKLFKTNGITVEQVFG